MTFSFIKNLLGVKTDQAVNGAIEALVRWDPKASTEAELRSMEDNLDQLGRSVATAQAVFVKEKHEADQIKALFGQRVAAAEILQQQLDAEQDPAKRSSLEHSLASLMTIIESMPADVEREAQDAVDAKEFLDGLQQRYVEAGNKLKAARADLERAQRDMNRADQQLDLAKQREQAAREAAGLSGATNGIDVALKAMQDAANKASRDAAAADTKARLLTPSNPEKSDDNIAAALAAAQGKPVGPKSLAERLAAVKAHA